MDECRILVVDDDADMARAIADSVSNARYRCEVATSAAYALTLSRQMDFDVVISDVRMDLLSNALKFTPPGGIVCVRAGSTEDVVTVAVSDTGAGMPPEVLARAFDRFCGTLHRPFARALRSPRSAARASRVLGLARRGSSCAT